MKHVKPVVTLSVLLIFGTINIVWAQEDGKKESGKDILSVEAEFYAGQRGYLDCGLILEKPIGEKMYLGLSGHFVRESSEDGNFFPSLGAEFGIEIADGFDLNLFSFGYLPNEEQDVVAGGVSVEKVLLKFSAGEKETVFSALFSPVFASVRAIDEDTETPVRIGYFMLLAGLKLERDPLELQIFGNQSFFTADTAGRGTHLDLGEMTRIVSYENNDGFARNSVGTEINYSPVKRLTFSGRYVAIWFKGLKVRHSIFPSVTVNIWKGLEFTGGVQIIRGGEQANTLGAGGIGFHF